MEKILLVTGVHELEASFGADVVAFLRKTYAFDPNRLIIQSFIYVKCGIFGFLNMS